jgi:hypothetical protein
MSTATALTSARVVAMPECPDGALWELAPNERKCYGVPDGWASLRRSSERTIVECAHLCAEHNATIPCVLDEDDNLALGKFWQRRGQGAMFVGRYQTLSQFQGETPSRSGWNYQNHAAEGCSSTFNNWEIQDPNDFGCVEENCGFGIWSDRTRTLLWGDARCDLELHTCVCEWPGTTSDEFHEYMDEGLRRAGEPLRSSTGCSPGRFVAWNFLGGYVLPRSPDPRHISLPSTPLLDEPALFRMQAFLLRPCRLHMRASRESQSARTWTWLPTRPCALLTPASGAYATWPT